MYMCTAGYLSLPGFESFDFLGDLLALRLSLFDEHVDLFPCHDLKSEPEAVPLSDAVASEHEEEVHPYRLLISLISTLNSHSCCSRAFVSSPICRLRSST